MAIVGLNAGRGAWRTGDQAADSRTPRAKGVFEAARMTLKLVRLWRLRARERNELAQLDERDLRDIRLSRAEARNEINKSFWR